MYLFDNLPLEIIRFEIFPYLDYEGRNAVNACLPRQDRIPTPFAKDSNNILMIKIQTCLLKKLLDRTYKETRRHREILKLFRSFDKLSHIFQYNYKFHVCMIEKCKKYSKSDEPEYTLTTKYFKKTLVKLCADFLEVYKIKYPFKYNLNSGVWNPIQNRYVEKEGWRT